MYRYYDYFLLFMMIKCTNMREMNDSTACVLVFSVEFDCKLKTEEKN